MKADTNNIKPQLPSPSQQSESRISWSTKFLTKPNNRGIIIGINTQQELRLWHMHLNIIQLIEIIKCRFEDTSATSKDQ